MWHVVFVRGLLKKEMTQKFRFGTTVDDSGWTFGQTVENESVHRQ